MCGSGAGPVNRWSVHPLSLDEFVGFVHPVVHGEGAVPVFRLRHSFFEDLLVCEGGLFVCAVSPPDSGDHSFVV